MRKKIGVLTFHIAHNYGAMLQAYALPKALEALGYDCETIHYCFPYIYPWGHIEYLPELCEKHGKVGGFLRFVKRSVKGEYRLRLKKVKFERFIYHTMTLSEKSYHFSDEMNNMDYDTVIFGSDQIWNSQLTNGIAEEYVGGFDCLEKTKKIAYAASCGRSSFTQEECEHYYPLLKAFSAIGVREQGFCESLCNDGFAAKTVLDPTLLLSKKQWSELPSKRKHSIKTPKKDYLLVYVFDEDPAVYGFVDKLAEKFKLEICVIAYSIKDEIKKYNVYDNCGPEDFVELFAGAARVVTTSFHGMVFSILFEKEFYCIPHPTLHERTDSLLSLLGLEERNCTDVTNIPDIKEIDWHDVGERLDELRNESLKFLKEAIG